eukprot:scaffold207_cov409-Prasinococcus_capsulatus_cf.AAC.113
MSSPLGDSGALSPGHQYESMSSGSSSSYAGVLSGRAGSRLDQHPRQDPQRPSGSPSTHLARMGTGWLASQVVLGNLNLHRVSRQTYVPALASLAEEGADLKVHPAHVRWLLVFNFCITAWVILRLHQVGCLNTQGSACAAGNGIARELRTMAKSEVPAALLLQHENGRGSSDLARDEFLRAKLELEQDTTHVDMDDTEQTPMESSATVQTLSFHGEEDLKQEDEGTLTATVDERSRMHDRDKLLKQLEQLGGLLESTGRNGINPTLGARGEHLDDRTQAKGKGRRRQKPRPLKKTTEADDSPASHPSGWQVQLDSDWDIMEVTREVTEESIGKDSDAEDVPEDNGTYIDTPPSQEAAASKPGMDNASRISVIGLTGLGQEEDFLRSQQSATSSHCIFCVFTGSRGVIVRESVSQHYNVLKKCAKVKFFRPPAGNSVKQPLRLPSSLDESDLFIHQQNYKQYLTGEYAITDATARALPSSFSEVKKTLDFKRCAIVGNSGALQQSRYGENSRDEPVLELQ